MGNPLTHSAAKLKGSPFKEPGASLTTLREVAEAYGAGVPLEELSRRSGLAIGTLRVIMTGDVFKALAAGVSLGA